MGKTINANALWESIIGKYDSVLGLGDLMEELVNAPAVEPRKGKWIEGHRMNFDGTFYWYRECDQCGYERNDDNTEKDSNYCPNCGAEMEGGERSKHG